MTPMKVTLGLLFSALLIGQPGWHTIKDKTGACQLSVPPNWTLLSDPDKANSPDHITTIVRSGMRAYRPWSEETLKMLNIDKSSRTPPSAAFTSPSPAEVHPHSTTTSRFPAAEMPASPRSARRHRQIRKK